MAEISVTTRITIATRTTKKSGVVNLRLRFRAGRGIDLYYTSNIKLSVSDLRRLQPDGTAKKKLNTSLWDDSKLTDKIAELKLQIEAAYANMLSKDTEINSKNFKAEVNEQIYHIEENKRKQQEKENKLTFYELTEKFYKDPKKNLETNTINSYRAFVRTICRWERFRRLVDGDDFVLDLETLTKDDIEGFIDYIKAEHELAQEYPAIFDRITKNYPIGLVGNRKIEQRGERTRIKMIKRLKAIINWALKNGHTTNNPIAAIEIGDDTKKDTPIYLSKEERNQLATFDVDKAYNELPDEERKQIRLSAETLKQQRDIFVFDCYVGARVYDLQRFTELNITNNKIHYIPHKTIKKKQTKLQIPLGKVPLALMNKYKGIDRKGRLFPFISDQRYNDAIKVLFRLAGLTRSIERVNPTTGVMEFVRLCDVASSHMARRTFVGTLYNGGISKAVIGTMSGHDKDSDAFWRYAEPNDAQRMEAIKALS